jgi:nitroreductase
MNETLKTIFRRRSIRSYTGEQVSVDALKLILDAGRQAPSAMNEQPWHFTVIRRKSLLERLEEICKEVFLNSSNEALRQVARREGFSVFYGAPMLIVISSKATAIAPQYDCTLAMENMMLAAASLDVGSCWMHSLMMLYDSDEGRQVATVAGLVFPEGETPFAAAVFGYHALAVPEAPHRKQENVTFID